jgi:hypothetical protein
VAELIDDLIATDLSAARTQIDRHHVLLGMGAHCCRQGSSTDDFFITSGGLSAIESLAQIKGEIEQRYTYTLPA